MRPLSPKLLREHAQHIIARDPLPGVDGVRAAQVSDDINGWLAPVIEDINEGSYAPQPYLRFWLNTLGQHRPIDCPALIDRVVMSAVGALLSPKLNVQTSVYGVARRGWQSAIKSIEAELAANPELYAFSYDIEDFFPSIQHDPLLDALSQRLHPSALAPAKSWLEAPSISGERILPGRAEAGIPQGASVSPLFAQLYLQPFDEALQREFPQVTHYRYLDDCLAIGADPDELKALRTRVRELLRALGLKLNNAKLSVGKLGAGKVKYLGHTFTPEGSRHHRRSVHRVRIIGSKQTQLSTELARYALKRLEADPQLWERGESQGVSVRELYALELDQAGDTHRWYHHARFKRPLRTLYLLDTPAKVRVDRGALVIKPHQGRRRELPLSHIGQVVAIGPVEMTSAAMRYFLSDDIPVLFLSKGGNYYGRLDSAKRQREGMLEAQFLVRAHPERQLDLARQVVRGRLHNARILLSRNNRKAKRRDPEVAEMILKMRRAGKALLKATSLDEIRGIEGSATRDYWCGYAGILPQAPKRRGEPPERPFKGPTWGFAGRNRRPPLDPVNSLISFLSVLLMYNVYSIIELCGLTPYVGVLHSSTRRAPALALDMMEEFRAPLVESVVLGLFGRGMLTLEDFEWRDTSRGEGVFLRDQALEVVVRSFERALNAEREHPQFGLRGDMRRMIHLQVLHFTTCMSKDVTYVPFMLR